MAFEIPIYILANMCGESMFWLGHILRSKTMNRAIRRFVAVVAITTGCVAAINTAAPTAHAGGVPAVSGPLKVIHTCGGVPATGGPLIN
jgi:hypothetical protein